MQVRITRKATSQEMEDIGQRWASSMDNIVGEVMTVDSLTLLHAHTYAVHNEVHGCYVVPKAITVPYYDERTRLALLGSIEKWRKITYMEEEDLGTNNCPLCEEFRWITPACGGCPIAEDTGKPYCEETPYEDRIRLHTMVNVPKDEYTKAAEDEYFYLRRLYEHLFPRKNPKKTFRETVPLYNFDSGETSSLYKDEDLNTIDANVYGIVLSGATPTRHILLPDLRNPKHSVGFMCYARHNNRWLHLSLDPARTLEDLEKGACTATLAVVSTDPVKIFRWLETGRLQNDLVIVQKGDLTSIALDFENATQTLYNLAEDLNV